MKIVRVGLDLAKYVFEFTLSILERRWPPQDATAR
jgi:hypothetical protein